MPALFRDEVKMEKRHEFSEEFDNGIHQFLRFHIAFIAIADKTLRTMVGLVSTQMLDA